MYVITGVTFGLNSWLWTFSTIDSFLSTSEGHTSCFALGNNLHLQQIDAIQCITVVLDLLKPILVVSAYTLVLSFISHHFL